MLVASAGLLGAGAVVAQGPYGFSASREHPAIQYETGPVDNAVSRLNQRLATGAASLSFEGPTGYLASVLEALDIAVQSQVLVFSETSNRAELIGPSNPRALFFNDATAVGWTRGSNVLEVATHDPRQGAVFYELEQTHGGQPRFQREVSCLLCHLSWDTTAVPGFLTMSTFPMSDDKNAYASGVAVNHMTPLDLRWGGWYVTGKAAPAPHYGNLPVIRPAAELEKPAPPTPRHESVEGLFDTTGYLTRTSDVAALMVLNHQTHMINLLTRVGWEARVAAYATSRSVAGSSADTDPVTQAAVDVVDYLLFVDEAPFGRPIEGSSGFAAEFSARGPADSRGRSLRQLDLRHRLLRYPCSYMIYSEAFDALPSSAKEFVYARLWEVLSGAAAAGDMYGHLTLDDRQAIVEILRETKQDLPSYFEPVTH